jgi:hypothetical protein
MLPHLRRNSRHKEGGCSFSKHKQIPTQTNVKPHTKISFISFIHYRTSAYKKYKTKESTRKNDKIFGRDGANIETRVRHGRDFGIPRPGMKFDAMNTRRSIIAGVDPCKNWWVMSTPRWKF